MSSTLKPIAIVGRSRDTGNYEKAMNRLALPAMSTLSIGDLQLCSALLLPGGGDITPAFFGQKKAGSKNIDTELDILQLQALEYAVRTRMPVLGICKGMQLINVFFGGTIVQHMTNSDAHAYNNGDRYHSCTTAEGSFLYRLYGPQFTVNSAHHQCIDKTGRDLSVIQYAADGTPEAVVHSFLPIAGVQWHPERLMPFSDSPSVLLAGTDGSLLLSLLGSLASHSADAQIYQ